MTLIKLKGALHPEILTLGFKEGDVVNATSDTVGKKGAMYFEKTIPGGVNQNCVVWPDNYTILRSCSWCGKQFEGDGLSDGRIISKRFCSFSCHQCDYEHYHDNFMSDADPGL